MVSSESYSDKAMNFTNADQLREVFLSCGMGFLLGVLDDGFRLVRRYLIPPKVIVFLLDILYAAVSAFLVFLFCLAMTQGRVRFYTLLAVLCGLVVYRITVGKMTSFVIDRTLTFFGRLGDKCERWTDGAVCCFKRWICATFRKLLEKVEKIRKKAKKFSKKGCKKMVE